MKNEYNIWDKMTSENKFEHWDEIDIPEDLLRGIYGYGFEEPSPIQKSAILPFQQGHDILAQAQSGTGKTGAFTIGTLLRVDVSLNAPQAIILAPTRELARQIHGVITALGKLYSVRSVCMVGGGSVQESIGEFKKKDKPHVVVGTSGRVYDLMKRRVLSTSNIRVMVLDEVDEMLSKGFKKQIYDIFHFIAQDVQLCLFSATIPEDIETLTARFMRDPVKILVKTDMLTLKGIKQYYIALENDDHKFATLKDIFEQLTVSQCMIYCNTVQRVMDLYQAMMEDGFPVARIHSGMTEEERRTVYEEFKSGKHRVLISSNLTARGIDVQQVSIVMNFDLPQDVHTYLHRIGRSGRYGRKGVGINFITKDDVRMMRELEQYYNTSIEELPSTFTNEL